MRKISLILRTDSYKPTHGPVYPEGFDYLHSYLESRGGLYPTTVFFGLQYYLKEYLSQQVTQSDVDYANKRLTKHYGDPKAFSLSGWQHIVDKHNGFVPIRIRAVPEGSVVPTHNVLMAIESTCTCGPHMAQFAVNYVESLLLKGWYPTTVATRSREIKKIINDFLEKTGDVNLLPFKLHDFGYRGVSSEESAMIGGMAHLVNFMGTDTLVALEAAEEIYGIEMAGFSIPATEHSIMTALGELGEAKQLDRFFKTFENVKVPAIACVGDSYDIFRFAKEYVGQNLKHQIETFSDKVFVLRPDSGTPHVIVRQMVEALDGAFGHTVNDKGFKVLNHVRVIQGDGINVEEVRRILDALAERHFSADNVAFGMGGQLLQAMDRDTQRFAIKASCIGINGVYHDVQKKPVTDNNKRSKPGRLKLIEEEGVFSTVPVTEIGHDVMQVVWENGKLLIDQTFDEIRERAALTNKSAPVWL
jgi:nicotinamide phosphoribosyltransferase